jgi:predicted transcriptional regulator
MPKDKPATSRAQTARTGNGDIFMSIKPEHINNIAAGTKNHEYRRYLLSSSIRRIWFYTTAPVSQIQYVASISRGKVAGEVPEDGGIGNADFNAGKKESKYAYEIRELWRLKEPLSLKFAISKGFLNGPPQKYCWVSLAFLKSYPLDTQDRIISKPPEEKHHVESSKRRDPEECKISPSLNKERKISDFFRTSDQITK